jgi:hypothetical protein
LWAQTEVQRRSADLDNQKAMKGAITRRILELIAELEEEY